LAALVSHLLRWFEPLIFDWRRWQPKLKPNRKERFSETPRLRAFLALAHAAGMGNPFICDSVTPFWTRSGTDDFLGQKFCQGPRGSRASPGPWSWWVHGADPFEEPPPSTLEIRGAEEKTKTW